MKKDLNQRNNLILWGIVTGLSFFIIFGVIISMIDLEILRNKNLIKDWHIRVGLFFLALLAAIKITNWVIKLLAERINDKYLERFHFLPEYQSFSEARWRFNFGEKRYKHAVLLLHGFSGSTQEFQFLIPKLEELGIPYIAPAILGFGNTKTVILNKATRKDWYRLSLAYFDCLSSVAEKVSIVGHSMGGVLASYIAEHRQTNHLILCSPGIYCAKTDVKYRKLLMNPFFAYFYIRLIPYLPKTIRPERDTCSDTLDGEYAKNIFQYLAIPIKSLRELFFAQEDVNLAKMKCFSLSVLYGKYELTVDIDKLFQVLGENQIKYYSYCFENSAHNVLEDFDRERSCQLVVDILTSK